VLTANTGVINPGMAIAPCLTYIPDEDAFAHAEPFSAAVAEDTLMLAGQLADALEILVQCHARTVPVSDEFLAYIDELTEQIRTMQPCQAIHAA